MSVPSMVRSADMSALIDDGAEAVFALVPEYSAEDFELQPAGFPFDVSGLDRRGFSSAPASEKHNESAAGNGSSEIQKAGLNYFVLALSVFPVFTVFGNLLVVLSGT